MPRSDQPVRVEPGLYLAGKTYIAVATPPGSRRERKRTLGEVGIMEARRLRNSFREELQNGGAAAAAIVGKATFVDVADAWLAHITNLRDIGKLGERTWDKYEGDLRLHVRTWFGTRQIASITADDLVAWHRDQCALGASEWAIRARWVVLRGVLGHGVRHRLLAANPADSLESREVPKAGEGRQRFLTPEEMARLLERAPANYRAAIATCLFTGTRQAELLGITWRDVDFAGEKIHVEYQMGRGRNPKRKRLKTKASIREIVMMPALASLLRKHRLAAPWSRDDDLVFATTRGTTIGHRNLAQRGLDKATGATSQKEAVKKAERAAAKGEAVPDPYEPCGLEDVTFHALRHTFASLLIAQGRDVVFVSRQLGHADPSITLKVYAHLFHAARHAEEARNDLERDYGSVLRAAGGTAGQMTLLDGGGR